MTQRTIGKTTLATLLALPGAALAQDEAVELAPVSVTATGYETLIEDTPASVTVIDRDEIRNRPGVGVGDLLRGEAGLATAVDGSVGQDPIIRGLKRDQVLVLVDGVRVNAMQPPARGSLASYVNMDLIERIEIVRGPSSVLYGSGAMGGVINIITRSGDFTEEEEINAWSRLGYSSVDRGLRSALGVTASNERHVLDFSTAYLDTDDYRMGDGDRLDDSGTRQQAYHLRYRTRLTPDHELGFRAQRDEREDVWYLASRSVNDRDPENDPLPDQLRAAPEGLNTHYTPTQTRDLLEATYQGDFGGAWAPRVEASIYRQELSRGNYDWSHALGRDYRVSDTDFTTDGARIQTELFPTDNQILLVGAEYWRLRASPDSFIGHVNQGFRPNDAAAPFEVLLTDPDALENRALFMDLIDDGQIDSQGMFVQHETFLDAGTLNLGMRYDRVEGDADAVVESDGDLQNVDHNLSWSAGFNWDLREEVNPYVSLSEGYRSASLLERYLTYEYSDGYRWIADPQLDPERNRTLEVGARGHLQGFSYMVSAYESRIRDYIGAVVLPGTQNQRETVNLDEARIRGVELQVQRPFTEHVSGEFTGTWIRGENRDSRFDEPLAEMPPPEASIALRRSVEQGWQWEGRLRAVARQDRTADRFTDNTERETSGFATGDLLVGYRFQPSGLLRHNELTFQVNNIADKAYREHVTGQREDQIDPARGAQEILAPGRSFGVVWYAEF
ncbi:TonB-dependent siderophore receptor [Thioalkalivibrio sp. ALE23]|uniref:TonB-dependent receptor plug domain-containing protein n=1 Tax=Thioalkalivibrio sp. ALE23 TaxID=1265495 RepID=UPI00039D1322|nr:TonB-dependent receptor [Thioalkalivibrio sp. ALE23]